MYGWNNAKIPRRTSELVLVPMLVKSKRSGLSFETVRIFG
jgi:hypothetical protein